MNYCNNDSKCAKYWSRQLRMQCLFLDVFTIEAIRLVTYFSFYEFPYNFSRPYPPIESPLSYPDRNIAAYTTIQDHTLIIVTP